MNLQNITQNIAAIVDKAPDIKAKIKIDLGDKGCVFIDSTQSPAAVSNEDNEADVTLSCSTETFEGLLNGTQDPTMAFMMGKLKVAGSMGLAMKLNEVLEG